MMISELSLILIILLLLCNQTVCYESLKRSCSVSGLSLTTSPECIDKEGNVAWEHAIPTVCW